jgi:hypothetical protein
MKTKFSAMLAWVKAKTLSGILSGSQIRSGLDRIIGLRHFPYPGAVGLAGLSSGKAKTLPRAGFSLIPQPRLG